MDWKRIMNKKKRQKDMVGKQEIKAAEYVVAEEAIKQYLASLLPEWNLRLLTDTETSADMVLWVESVTVTAYQSTPETKSSGKPEFWNPFRKRRDRESAKSPIATGDADDKRNDLPGWMKKCLMGKQDQFRSLKK